MIGLAAGVTLIALRFGERRRMAEVPVGGCTGCTIRLTRVAIIAPGAGVYAPLFNYAAVARAGTGNYIVAPVNAPGAAGVYGSNGRFVRGVNGIGRLWGNDGSEVAGLWSLDADSLLIVDTKQQRLVFADAELTGARWAPIFGAVLDAEVAPGGQIVVNSRLEHGGTLQLLARDGRFIRTLDGADRGGGVEGAARALAVDPAGWIYSAKLGKFEVEVRNIRGSLERTLTWRAIWFQAPRSVEPALRPSIRDLSVDSAGRLWVLGVVPLPPPESETRNKASYDGSDYVLEVVDTGRRTVLATGVTDRALVRWIAPGLLLSREHLEDGHTAFVVWNVTLDEP